MARDPNAYHDLEAVRKAGAGRKGRMRDRRRKESPPSAAARFQAADAEPG